MNEGVGEGRKMIDWRFSASDERKFKAANRSKMDEISQLIDSSIGIFIVCGLPSVMGGKWSAPQKPQAMVKILSRRRYWRKNGKLLIQYRRLWGVRESHPVQ
jgi:hypothetical protein